jgi:hypothetical protein
MGRAYLPATLDMRAVYLAATRMANPASRMRRLLRSNRAHRRSIGRRAVAGEPAT